MQGHMWTDQAAVLIGSLQLLTSPPSPRHALILADQRFTDRRQPTSSWGG